MKAFAKNGSTNDESLGGGFGLLNGGAPRALAPLWIFYPLVFISLALPNLIYSGADWFDTLHIMKWAWTMVPVAVISLIGGSMLALFGAGRTGFRLDLFGAMWLALLAFVSLQPLWCDIFAWSTYFKEWFFFASLLAAYIFCYNLFGSQAALRRVLWLANLNAAVNVVFAELLIRDMNDICPLIMNVPGNYIGNTGQQEMFGLWMAMAAMNGIYLHMVYSSPLCGCARRRLPMWVNLFLLAFNSWGLWNSTTRAGMLALFVGTAALALTALNCREDGRALTRRIGAAFALVGGVLLFKEYKKRERARAARKNGCPVPCLVTAVYPDMSLIVNGKFPCNLLECSPLGGGAVYVSAPFSAKERVELLSGITVYADDGGGYFVDLGSIKPPASGVGKAAETE